MTAAFAYLVLGAPPIIRRKPYRPSSSRYRFLAIQEAARAGVTLEDLMSLRRHPPLPAVRWRVWRQLKDEGASLPGIADRAGLKNHTTILHGLRRLAEIEAAASPS